MGPKGGRGGDESGDYRELGFSYDSQSHDPSIDAHQRYVGAIWPALSLRPKTDKN